MVFNDSSPELERVHLNLFIIGLAVHQDENVGVKPCSVKFIHFNSFFFFLHVLMKQLVHQVCGQLSLKIDLCFAYTWSSHPLKRIEKSSTFYVNMDHVVSTDELDIIKPL